MATPNVTTTKESTNYARLCRLLIDVGSKALRDIFDGFYTPGNLHAFLSSSSVQSKLESPRKRKILHPTQWSKLFPAVPTTVSSADFDITLLSVLLCPSRKILFSPLSLFDQDVWINIGLAFYFLRFYTPGFRLGPEKAKENLAAQNFQPFWPHAWCPQLP